MLKDDWDKQITMWMDRQLDGWAKGWWKDRTIRPYIGHVYGQMPRWLGKKLLYEETDRHIYWATIMPTDKATQVLENEYMNIMCVELSSVPPNLT